jgi:predicted HTH domain antitoxin
MALQSVTVDLPEEIVALLGSDQPPSEAARKAIILSLLREAKISQGKAAELLGISMWEMMDLIVEQDIQTGPQTAEEIDEEIATARCLAVDLHKNDRATQRGL